MKITNNHSTALGLPSGIELLPGVATSIPNWPEVKKNAVVKAWVEANVLSEELEEGDVDEARAAVMAQLDALGAKYDKRLGLEKLQAALDDAQKAKVEG